jgi:hypothetical protein
MRAYDAREDKNQPEEAKAMQGSDGAMRFEPAHRPEPGQNVNTEAKQPRDIP